jgi:hypothetical protein
LPSAPRERYAIFEPGADPEPAAKYNRVARAQSNVSGILHWLAKPGEASRSVHSAR